MGLLNGKTGATGQNAPYSLPPQLKQNIQQVKNMMRMFNGDPNALMQQNPMVNQVMQMCQGQSPEALFKSLCKQQGLDCDEILRMLKD